MPPRSRWKSPTRRTPSRVASAWGLVLCLAATLATSISAQAHALPCGVSLSPEDIVRRLNETRARGANCRPTGSATTGAPLRWSESLAAVAQVQAGEMAMLRRMGHRDSANRGLGERLKALGYQFSAAAENVAVGYPSLDDVIDAWLVSVGHCENLMSPTVVELGLACIDGDDAVPPAERRYWTLVLGAPARPR